MVLCRCLAALTLVAVILHSTSGFQCIDHISNTSCCGQPGVCYVIRNETYSWTDANRACADISNGTGHLAEISNHDTQQFISAQMARLNVDSAWIGAHLQVEAWSWLSTKTLDNSSYSNWAIGQPNDAEGRMTCAYANNKNNLSWVADFCAVQHTFICSISLKESDCSSLNHSNVFANRTCLISPEESLTWFEARQWCLGVGGDLVVLSHREVEQAIGELISADKTKAHSWIGLTLSNWRWTSKGAVVYTHWEKSESGSGKGKGCVILKKFANHDTGDPRYFWVSATCQSTHAHVCQIPAAIDCSVSNTYSCERTVTGMTTMSSIKPTTTTSESSTSSIEPSTSGAITVSSTHLHTKDSESTMQLVTDTTESNVTLFQSVSPITQNTNSTQHITVIPQSMNSTIQPATTIFNSSLSTQISKTSSYSTAFPTISVRTSSQQHTKTTIKITTPNTQSNTVSSPPITSSTIKPATTTSISTQVSSPSLVSTSRQQPTVETTRRTPSSTDLTTVTPQITETPTSSTAGSSGATVSSTQPTATIPRITTASVPKETMPKGQTTSPDRTFQSTFQESTTYLYSTPTKRVESLVTQEAMAGTYIIIGTSIAAVILLCIIVGISCHCARQRRKRKLYMRHLKPDIDLYNPEEMEKKYFARAASDTVSNESENSNVVNDAPSGCTCGKNQNVGTSETIITAYGGDLSVCDCVNERVIKQTEDIQTGNRAWELYSVNVDGEPTWNWKLSDGENVDRDRCIL